MNPVQTFKRTTIYISFGASTKVYDSPDAIPQPLRKRLLRSTRSMNSATILIADRGGREEIRKILDGEPSALKGRLRSDYFQRRAEAAQGADKKARNESSALEAPAVTSVSSPTEAPRTWMRIAELSLPAALGIALWLLFTLK